MRFPYLLLAHIALTYFFVRSPAGTYEDELVTEVYDVLSIVFLGIALIEGAIRGEGGIRVSRVGFFWGLGTMIVSLGILSADPGNWPETWICLAIVAVAAALGLWALVVQRRSAAESG